MCVYGCVCVRACSRTLLEGHEFFQVPEVVEELSGRKVLAMELIHGVPLDRCVDLDQETRNKVTPPPRCTGTLVGAMSTG